MLIGELTTLSGLSKDGIRHYEELGLISSTSRRAGSREYRDYDVKTLEMILKVRNAQRLGFALKDIGPLIKDYEAKRFSNEEVINILSERLQDVRDKIRELRQTETYIEEKIGLYQRTRDIDTLVRVPSKRKKHSLLGRHT
ncbi:MAG TPA: MerR family DNA-binding protein [Acidobacteriaceae bacterium]|jgi:DNA-binding transcriptional MerR regulator